MDDGARPRPSPHWRERLRRRLVPLGLLCGVALTLGWRLAIGVGLYRIIG